MRESEISTTLVAAIGRVIGECEDRARAARAQGEDGGVWSVEADPPKDPESGAFPAGVFVDDVGENGVVFARTPGIAAHVAGNDPDGVLRRCVLDRKVLAGLERATAEWSSALDRAHLRPDLVAVTWAEVEVWRAMVLLVAEFHGLTT